MAILTMAETNYSPEWAQIVFSLALAGFLATLGNIYVQRTNPWPEGAGPVRIRGVLLPFVSLKMLLDGLIYFLWIQALSYWEFPAWGKVVVTSGFYTPLYYVVFFYGLEIFEWGPIRAFSPTHRRQFFDQLWFKLKPVWRVDFWYFLIADSVSFYGGPAVVALLGGSAAWNDPAVFVIFSLFDFFFDILLSRALHRHKGRLTEQQVYFEARKAADLIIQAARRRKQKRR